MVGLQTKVHNADTRSEIDAASAAMDRDRPDAVFIGSSVFLNGRRVQLAQLSTCKGFKKFLSRVGRPYCATPAFQRRQRARGEANRHWSLPVAIP